MKRSAIPFWPAMMSEDLASAYLGRSAEWLRRARLNGKAPQRVLLEGAPMYRRSDLDIWIATLPTEAERVRREEASDADKAFGCASLD